MKRKHPKPAGQKATASGAVAAGAASVGALVLGATALGAFAVGALAIGRLSVRSARLRRVEIDDLAIGRLTIGEPAFSFAARLQAEPGRGDELLWLILGIAAAIAPRGALVAHRSVADPDLFLLQACWTEAGSQDPEASPPIFETLFRTAAAQGLIASPAGDGIALDIFRTI